MKFYQEIAKYYDDIFPVKDLTLQFVESRTPKGGNILDVGCATGGYAVALAKSGYTVKGIDLSDEMIVKAKQKGKGLENLHFSKEDIFNADESKQYNTIYCIGNTLPHFLGLKQIEMLLSKLKKLLKPEGKLIIQTVNYDRILKENVDSLPTIKNPDNDLKFFRNYSLTDGFINFETTLQVPEKQLTNNVRLYPITSKEIMEMLSKLEYRKINVYGAFNEAPFELTSFPMIISCSK
ncbi:class I SAM-dependent methyltransferase [Proteinivorax hydrogeniformans]|uniref:Class I SAM-dependent methyltransferase n=1 Tax=Proteinivorax hydrogeniformans TaxID=1826727 RepID=A0AAU8HQE9_9FIRM